MIKVEISDIEYDVSDSLGIENFSLPKTITHDFECNLEDLITEIEDHIANFTGFCAFSFSYTQIS